MLSVAPWTDDVTTDTEDDTAVTDDVMEDETLCRTEGSFSLAGMVDAVLGGSAGASVFGSDGGVCDDADIVGGGATGAERFFSFASFFFCSLTNSAET